MANQKLMYQDGRIVRIRVNPQDCMSAIDVLAKLELIEPGMSFSVVISTALHYLLQAARDSGMVETRDGFEYAAMMAVFKDQPHLDRTRKLQVTKEFQLMQRRPVKEIGASFSSSPKVAAKQRLLAELVAKAEIDPLNADADEMNRLREEILHGS